MPTKTPITVAHGDGIGPVIQNCCCGFRPRPGEICERRASFWINVFNECPISARHKIALSWGVFVSGIAEFNYSETPNATETGTSTATAIPVPIDTTIATTKPIITSCMILPNTLPACYAISK